MREYIIYAILIFLPLGFLMACFLNKQGFTKKQISCFTIAALAAVILFPISAAKMGTTPTGIIFVFVLALFSWQIMKVEQVLKDEEIHHPEIEQAEPLLPPTDIAAGLAKAETAATEPDTPNAEDLQLTGEEKTEPDMNQVISHAIDEDQCAAATEDASSTLADNMDQVERPGTMPEPLELMVDSDPNYMEKNEIEDYVAEEDEPTPEEETEDGTINLDPVTITVDGFNGEKLPEEPGTEADTPTVVEVINEQDTDNATIEVINEADDTDNAVAEVMNETDDTDKITAEAMNEIDDTEKMTAEVINESDDRDNTTPEITPETDNQDHSQVINSLIDAGFENKLNGNVQEAIRCFESAFQLTDSADLKYLLSQELVLHYEILGQYTNAINITKNTIGSGLIPTAGLNQAQHKLEYLQHMVEELERLGMGEVPVSEVPRLVKIKVGQITR